MTADARALPGVVGRGEAAGAAPSRDRFQAAAVKAIRYADPAAWRVVAAVADAASPVRAAGDRVGVVVTSADGPVEAMAAMCEAARGGSSSPIRFPASNAGSLAGLACIALGFRGPTLMLTMPPARGVPIALLLAETWLTRGVADYVAVAAHAQASGARCLLLGGDPQGPAAGLTPHDIAWLSDAR
jgi:hypothetical protein